MHPTEKSELLFEITLLQRRHKPDKSDGVKCEADNSVICCEGMELGIREYDMLVYRGVSAKWKTTCSGIVTLK